MALEERPVSIPLKTTTANGIHMRYAEMGPRESGAPLVLFCHGWPESWYSWRHQLAAVSAAGFRCVAPDMRGYGGTEAPEGADQYTLMHLVGDMAELVKALGETKAVIVGHDWGAPVAWHAAMWRPDLFPAVCAMSVPYAPPGYIDILTALSKLGINDFYLQYFQKPGVPEAERASDLVTLVVARVASGEDVGALRAHLEAALPPGTTIETVRVSRTEAERLLDPA